MTATDVYIHPVKTIISTPEMETTIVHMYRHVCTYIC